MKEWGWIEDSPMKKVRKPQEPRGRVRFLSDEERNTLLETAKKSSNPFLYLVIVLALSTGMRQGEIMNLRCEDIDVFRGRIILHETKNGERRTVPLRGLAQELIQQHISTMSKDIGLLFPSKNNQHKPMDLRFCWKKVLKEAKNREFSIS